MKYLILFMAFCLPGVAFPQSDYNCESYIKTTEDRMTGKTSVSANETIVVSSDGGKTGFGILLMKSNSGSIIFSIQAVGAGNCINDDAKMIVLFRDGSKINLVNDGKFNCDGLYTQYFLGIFGKNRFLRQFQEKEIEAIRISMRRGFVEENFTEENSEYFKRVVSCLVE